MIVLPLPVVEAPDYQKRQDWSYYYFSYWFYVSCTLVPTEWLRFLNLCSGFLMAIVRFVGCFTVKANGDTVQV